MISPFSRQQQQDSFSLFSPAARQHPHNLQKPGSGAPNPSLKCRASSVPLGSKPKDLASATRGCFDMRGMGDAGPAWVTVDRHGGR